MQELHVNIQDQTEEFYFETTELPRILRGSIENCFTFIYLFVV